MEYIYYYVWASLILGGICFIYNIVLYCLLKNDEREENEREQSLNESLLNIENNKPLQVAININ